MLAFFKKLFQAKDYKALRVKGATIVDVRSVVEYNQGHIDGSENIPLQQIQLHIKKLTDLNSLVILCCASGMRSGKATLILKSAGIDAHNGGGWMSLNSKL